MREKNNSLDTSIFFALTKYFENVVKHFKRKDGIKPYFARTHGQQQCLRILSEVTGSIRQWRRHFRELIRITLHYLDQNNATL